jgi:hypothetical protein
MAWGQIECQERRQSRRVARREVWDPHRDRSHYAQAGRDVRLTEVVSIPEAPETGLTVMPG